MKFFTIPGIRLPARLPDSNLFPSLLFLDSTIASWFGVFGLDSNQAGVLLCPCTGWCVYTVDCPSLRVLGDLPPEHVGLTWICRFRLTPASSLPAIALPWSGPARLKRKIHIAPCVKFHSEEIVCFVCLLAWYLNKSLIMWRPVFNPTIIA